MRDLILTRYYTLDQTFGTLFGDQGLQLVTIEQPWCGNKPFKSCVPEGEYKVIRDSRPKHEHTFCLVNEDLGIARYPANGMRDSCLFHVANTVLDIEGCIGPGLDFGYVKNMWAVIASVPAFRKLNGYIGEDNEFNLLIRQYKPAPWR